VSSILDHGDHFIVATEKQRGYMLGFISSRGKIHVGSFPIGMVSILPNTLDVSFSRNKTKRLRGQLAASDDKIILWLGGVYPWFNPESLIKAMPAILKNVNRAKLFIIGGKNPTVGFDYVYQGAKKAANELGKDNSKVVFIDWVVKEQSFAYCSEADVFVILSKPTLEDEFAYRTRTLTALTLGIPAVTNGRDYLSGLITKHHAGIVCATDSPEEIASALSKILLDDDERSRMSDNTKKVIKEIQNDIDERPLLNFFKQPTRTQIVRMSPMGRLRLFAKIFLSR
jgi:glycosyltransferase involved in cell wall biosynthesis